VSDAGRSPAAEVGPGGDLSVVVVADDLIWATRLVGQLRTLGASPLRVASVAALEEAIAAAAPRRAVVDLTARAYDGVDATRRAAAAGLRVLGVGQHDDRELRAAARAAGADHVYAYRKLFEDGHAVLAAWLGVPLPAPGSRAIPDPAGRAEVGPE
jgi:CheY-like chemotaxis protein